MVYPVLLSWTKLVPSLLVVACALAQSREFFIDSEVGVDSATCGDAGTPCRTINHTDVRAINETNAILRLSGTHVFLNDVQLPNSGGWNQLIGDPDNPRNVVIDGRENSTRLMFWRFSDNNQSGPFYFDGITFTGFTENTVYAVGQHLDVRNCIFDFTGQHGANAIHARLFFFTPTSYPEERIGSNTSSIYAENVVTMNSAHENAMSIYCDMCHTTTLRNSVFYNGSDAGLEGTSAIYVRWTSSLLFENVSIINTQSCAAGAIAAERLSGNATFRNIVVRGVHPDRLCDSDRFGAIYVDEISGTVEFDGLRVSDATGGRGSALFFHNTIPRVIVRNGHFENNFANEFGTFYINIRDSDENMVVEIYDCVFTNNTARLAGGAIHLAGGLTRTVVRMERIDFVDGQVLDREEGSGGAINVVGNNWDIFYRGGSMSGNVAKFGGAVFVSASDLTTVEMHDLVIADNMAYSNGGAIYLQGGVEILTNLVFEGNLANNHGGCLFVVSNIGSNSDVALLRSTLTRCRALENGGAIYTDGGNIRVVDSTLAGSIAGNGGGVFHTGLGYLAMNDTTIANSSVGGGSLCAGGYGFGAGVYFEDDACYTTHTLFDDVSFERNTANLSGGAYFTHDIRCGEEWCQNCDFEDNEAQGFGSKASAPFNEFRPATEDPPSVTVGEKFFLEAVPFDAFGQQMAGNHELLSAVIDDASTSTELWLCGEQSTVASRGLARFALTVFLVADAEETNIHSRVNKGEDALVTLYMERDPNREFLGDDAAPDELELMVVGCPNGHELDLIPRDQFDEIASECSASDGDGASGVVAAVTMPDLLRCELITTLTADERTGAMVVTCIALVVGLAMALVAVYFRTNRVVWTSSLGMLAVSVVGFLMVQAAAILRIFRPTNSAMCMAFEWFYVLGLNVLMGASFSKNMRVWKIFTLKSLRVVHISNWLLIFGIVAASIPDVVALAIQTIAFPLSVDTSLRNSICASSSAGVFRALYAVFKTLWMVGGIGVAYLVRGVPAKFNEFKGTVLHVSFTFITLIIIWGIGDIVQARARTLVEVVTLSLVALALVCVVFAPKFFLIYKGRDGTLMSAHDGTQTQHTFSEKPAGAKGDGKDPNFKAQFRRLKEELERTQKLAARSHENTLELRQRFRGIESDIIAIQFEADYRADVSGGKKTELDEDDVDFAPPSVADVHRRSPSEEAVEI